VKEKYFNKQNYEKNNQIANIALKQFLLNSNFPRYFADFIFFHNLR